MQSLNKNFWPKDIIQKEKSKLISVLQWNRNENETLELINSFCKLKTHKVYSEISIEKLPRKMCFMEFQYLLEKIEIITPIKVIKGNEIITKKNLIIYDESTLKKYGINLRYLKILNVDNVINEKDISFEDIENYGYHDIILIGINPFFEKAISVNFEKSNIYKIVDQESIVNEFSTDEKIKIILFDKQKSLRKNLLVLLKRESIKLNRDNNSQTNELEKFAGNYLNKTILKKHYHYYAISNQSKLKFQSLIYFTKNRDFFRNHETFITIFLKTIIERWFELIHIPALIRYDLNILDYIFQQCNVKLLEIVLITINRDFARRNNVIKGKILIIVTIELIHSGKIEKQDINSKLTRYFNYNKNDQLFFDLLIDNKDNLECENLHSTFLKSINKDFINKSYGFYYFLVKFNFKYFLRQCTKSTFSLDYYRDIFNIILSLDDSCGYLKYLENKRFLNEIRILVIFLEKISLQRIYNDINFIFFKVVTEKKGIFYSLPSENFESFFWKCMFTYLLNEKKIPSNIDCIKESHLITSNIFKEKFIDYINKLTIDDKISSPSSILMHYVMSRKKLNAKEERIIITSFPDFYDLL